MSTAPVPRTGSRAARPEAGRDERLDRQRAGVLRLRAVLTAAALVFPTVFFPSGNPTVALIASLATYAVGYFARPIGAVVLGAYGDRHGRKNVLVFAMFLMGFSTFLVGVAAHLRSRSAYSRRLLLVVLRVIQGFAVAGELGGASAMIVEHSPDARRGFFASFSLQGTQAGSILATARDAAAGRLPAHRGVR